MVAEIPVVVLGVTVVMLAATGEGPAAVVAQAVVVVAAVATGVVATVAETANPALSRY